MADNDIVILGAPMSVVLYKPPDPMPPEHRRLLINVDVIGAHDDFMMITCRQPMLARLRAAEAEVIMLFVDANHYANRVENSSEPELRSLFDDRIEEAREGLRIAAAGRERDQQDS